VAIEIGVECDLEKLNDDVICEVTDVDVCTVMVTEIDVALKVNEIGVL
jgi:hypothetical protein